MKFVVLNTRTNKLQRYRDPKTGKQVRLELPTADHAQAAAEHLTRRMGYAFFACTVGA